MLCRYVVVSWKPMPLVKCCQYGSHTLYLIDHSRMFRSLTLYVPAGVAYPRNPVRTTVGPNATEPSDRITHIVCSVRSTHAVSAVAPGAHFARSPACRLAAMRRPTSAVVGPALPLAGLMPKRFWNLMIVAQSSGVWTPSTTTGP